MPELAPVTIATFGAEVIAIPFKFAGTVRQQTMRADEADQGSTRLQESLISYNI
jgi:hypothetical protein